MAGKSKNEIYELCLLFFWCSASWFGFAFYLWSCSAWIQCRDRPILYFTV